jgi:mRNA export factor
MSLFGASAATTAATTAAQQAQGDTSQDIPLQSPPDDSISDISFSPQSEHLAVASWDKKVRIYEIAADGSSAGKAMYDHEGPVLSVHWSKVMRTDILLQQPVLIKHANNHNFV